MPCAASVTRELLDHRFPPDTAELQPMRHRVRAALAGYGCGSEFTESSVLAVDEAIANVMRHGRWPHGERDLRLTIHVDDATVTFGLHDFAEPFDPSTCQPPEPDAARAGGYGLLIVKSVMDTIRYRSKGDGRENTLEMSRRLDLSPQRD